MKIKIYSRLMVTECDSNYGEQSTYFDADDTDAENFEAIFDESDTSGSGLAEYLNPKYDGISKEMVPSIIMSTEGNRLVATCEIANGVTLKDKVTNDGKETTVMDALLDYLSGQYSDGWGEGMEQQEISSDTSEEEIEGDAEWDEENSEWVTDTYTETITTSRYCHAWWSKSEAGGPFKFDHIEVVA